MAQDSDEVTEPSNSSNASDGSQVCLTGGKESIINPMPNAKLRTNPDLTLVEIETPEGETFGPEVIEDEIICKGDGKAYLAAVGEHDCLDPDSLYELVKVETDIERDVELEEEEDGEDVEEDEEDDLEDEDEGEEAGTLP